MPRQLQAVVRGPARRRPSCALHRALEWKGDARTARLGLERLPADSQAKFQAATTRACKGHDARRSAAWPLAYVADAHAHAGPTTKPPQVRMQGWRAFRIWAPGACKGRDAPGRTHRPPRLSPGAARPLAYAPRSRASPGPQNQPGHPLWHRRSQSREHPLQQQRHVRAVALSAASGCYPAPRIGGHRGCSGLSSGSCALVMMKEQSSTTAGSRGS